MKKKNLNKEKSRTIFMSWPALKVLPLWVVVRLKSSKRQGLCVRDVRMIVVFSFCFIPKKNENEKQLWKDSKILQANFTIRVVSLIADETNVATNTAQQKKIERRILRCSELYAIWYSRHDVFLKRDQQMDKCRKTKKNIVEKTWRDSDDTIK